MHKERKVRRKKQVTFDFRHGPPKGPHWDYNDIYGKKWSITRELGRTVIRKWKNNRIFIEIFK